MEPPASAIGTRRFVHPAIDRMRDHVVESHVGGFGAPTEYAVLESNGLARPPATRDGPLRPGGEQEPEGSDAVRGNGSASYALAGRSVTAAGAGLYDTA
jgi:hypothetical protein